MFRKNPKVHTDAVPALPDFLEPIPGHVIVVNARTGAVATVVQDDDASLEHLRQFETFILWSVKD